MSKPTTQTLVMVGAMIQFACAWDPPRANERHIELARAQMHAFREALQRYREDVDRFPSTDEGLNALRTNLDGNVQWHGPYLPADIPLDPWGRPYVYRYSIEQGDTPEIVSLGRDGKPGGDGDDADIVSER